MTSNPSVAMKHWARIIKQWPVDRVRPEHVHFQKVMQSRLQKISSPTAIAANAQSTAPEPFSEQNESRQLNALYSLLENRFEKEFPLPDRVRHPKTNPTHYDDLMKELDEAPSRSWTTSLWNRIKGSMDSYGKHQASESISCWNSSCREYSAWPAVPTSTEWFVSHSLGGNSVADSVDDETLSTRITQRNEEASITESMPVSGLGVYKPKTVWTLEERSRLRPAALTKSSKPLEDMLIFERDQ